MTRAFATLAAAVVAFALLTALTASNAGDASAEIVLDAMGIDR